MFAIEVRGNGWSAPIKLIQVQEWCSEIRNLKRVFPGLIEGRDVECEIVINELAEVGVAGKNVASSTLAVILLHLQREIAQCALQNGSSL